MTKPEDRYHRLVELGEGGMGVVSLAMAHGPRGFVKLVVLKQLHAHLLGSQSAYRMFLEEARVSARLSHPNVVQVFEVTELDGVPTIVMEYLEGCPLSQATSTPRLPRDLEIFALARVLTGLDACHELQDYDGTPLNLIHRDVSPHNIYLLFDGQVKVLDFGIAKAHGSRVHTEVGELKGKIRYMAPEQLFAEQQDRRVDVFAIGIILFEAITRSRLWGNRSDGEVLAALLNGPIFDAGRLADVPEPLRRICMKALAAEPEHRYATARDFRDDLQNWIGTCDDCTERNLAKFMEASFGESRSATKRVIQTAIDGIAPISVFPPPRRDSLTLREGPTLTTVGTTNPSPKAKPGPGWRARRWVMVAGAALLALGIGAVQAAGGWPSKGASASAASGAPLLAASAPTCAAHERLCDASCVSPDQPRYGCGAEGCRACYVPNATPRCNAGGQCDIAVCYQEYDDCDNRRDNGCETNVRIDPDHCGRCGNRCPDLPHATRGCGDVCTIWRCERGYRDCNGLVDDGCEFEARRGSDGRCPP